MDPPTTDPPSTDTSLLEEVSLHYENYSQDEEGEGREVVEEKQYRREASFWCRDSFLVLLGLTLTLCGSVDEENLHNGLVFWTETFHLLGLWMIVVWIARSSLP